MSFPCVRRIRSAQRRRRPPPRIAQHYDRRRPALVGRLSLQPNTDGFNIAGEDIVMRDCRVRNGDDCVPVFPPTRNMTVENMQCECGNGMVAVVWPLYSLPGQGGNITDLTFRNIQLNGTGTGVGIKSLPSYVGTASNIVYENVSMTDVTQAIMFNVFNQNAASAAAPPPLGVARIGNVTVRNVAGTAGAAGKVQCDPSAPCSGFAFENITITTDKGYECEHASGTAAHCAPQPCGWSPAGKVFVGAE